MTIEQSYRQFGGNFTETVLRLGKPELLIRLLKKFLDDSSRQQLAAAIDSGDWETAFRAAHTLKGVALNMGFTRLADSSSALTECLRAGQHEHAQELYDAVCADYSSIREALEQAAELS